MITASNNTNDPRYVRCMAIVNAMLGALGSAEDDPMLQFDAVMNFLLAWLAGSHESDKIDNETIEVMIKGLREKLPEKIEEMKRKRN